MCLGERLPHGVACHHYFIGREEAFHAVVGHAYALCRFGKQLVGHSGIRVLLLYECGYAHLCGGLQRGAAGVSAHSHYGIGLEVGYDFACHALAFPYLPQHPYVFQRVFTVETLDGQTLDGVSGIGHTLHLHASLCTHEEYFGVGALGLYGIGY